MEFEYDIEGPSPRAERRQLRRAQRRSGRRDRRFTKRVRKLARRANPSLPRRLGRAFAVLCGLGLLLGIFGAAFAGGWVKGKVDSAPDITDLPERSSGRNSIVYAADGSRLGYIRSDVLRTPVTYAQTPTRLRQATVAIEDRRFYEHRGVDFYGAVRAARSNLNAGAVREGASTLTMQLVRALYISNEQSLSRKIAEAKLATELERRKSKRWVLLKYLNNAPYGVSDGQELLGVEAASRAYFGKPAEALDLAQSALLAGIPQSPTMHNPLTNPEGARARRDDVLRAMLRSRYITARQMRAALREPVKVRSTGFYGRRRERYVFDYVRAQLAARYGQRALARGGLRIYTTISPRRQRLARAAVKAELNRRGDPEGAVVSVDPKTGRVLAMASSADYSRTQFDLASQGRRQPGSTFKTMVLVAALRKGINPEQVTYNSRPLDFTHRKYGPVKVKTYNGSYGGNMTVSAATLKSDNSVYTQLALDVGPAFVRSTARAMGITSYLGANPALALGGLRDGVTPLEMASAYATLAAGGVRSNPVVISKVRFGGGGVDYPDRRQPRRVLRRSVASQTTAILRANIKSGTGTKAKFGCEAAGKTGTTDNSKDAWFAGYTPRAATAVWVGYPRSGKVMNSVHGIQVTGGSFPAAIWKRYMTKANGRCRKLDAGKRPRKYARWCGPFTTSCTRSRPYPLYTSPPTYQPRPYYQQPYQTQPYYGR